MYINVIQKKQKWNLVNFEIFFQFLMEIIQGWLDSKTKCMACTLLEKWCQFDALFASIIILDLFSITSPLSQIHLIV